MKISSIFLKEQLLIQVAKHLILLKIQNTMDIKISNMMDFKNRKILIKKSFGANVQVLLLKVEICQTSILQT